MSKRKRRGRRNRHQVPGAVVLVPVAAPDAGRCVVPGGIAEMALSAGLDREAVRRELMGAADAGWLVFPEGLPVDDRAPITAYLTVPAEASV